MTPRPRVYRPTPYQVTRPDGTVWPRRFRTPGAAWGFIVRGANSRREWLERQLAISRAGWRVERQPTAD